MHKDLLRLIRGEQPVLRHLTVTFAAAMAAGLLVLVQAELLAGVLSGRFTVAALAAVAGVVALRALLAWTQGVFAGRTATGVKSALRHRLLSRLRELGPVRLAGHRSGELVTLAGRGLDGLDDYLTGYLPAIAVAAVVPLAVLVRLLAADLPSAIIVLVTLPLIPIFGALVGMTTKAVTERQYKALARLGGHFLDVVRGLPTLRAFGRARYQATVIREVADAHRSATMRTLRVAFLSSLVLELCASLSLALVAVPVGLRLLGGTLDLSTALLVLLLAPEAYLPLRAMGTRFHASMEGVAAADAAFSVLDRTDDERAERPERPGAAPAAGQPRIELENVTVRYPGRADPALAGVTLTIEPGERVALVGESGGGKSTLLNLLLGFVPPSEGRVLVDGADLGTLDPEAWRARLAYVPQRAHLFTTSVADNIRLGTPSASMAEVRRAARAAYADEFIGELPGGYETRVGERGANLSAGQRQRIALARAFCRPSTSVLLLDEPTARLDGRSEAAVVAATAELGKDRTAVIVAHRPAMIDLADRVIRVHDGRIISDTPRHTPETDPQTDGDPTPTTPEPGNGPDTSAERQKDGRGTEAPAPRQEAEDGTAAPSTRHQAGGGAEASAGRQEDGSGPEAPRHEAGDSPAASAGRQKDGRGPEAPTPRQEAEDGTAASSSHHRTGGGAEASGSRQEGGGGGRGRGDCGDGGTEAVVRGWGEG